MISFVSEFIPLVAIGLILFNENVEPENDAAAYVCVQCVQLSCTVHIYYAVTVLKSQPRAAGRTRLLGGKEEETEQKNVQIHHTHISIVWCDCCWSVIVLC